MEANFFLHLQLLCLLASLSCFPASADRRFGEWPVSGSLLERNSGVIPSVCVSSCCYSVTWDGEKQTCTTYQIIPIPYSQ